MKAIPGGPIPVMTLLSPPSRSDPLPEWPVRRQLATVAASSVAAPRQPRFSAAGHSGGRSGSWRALAALSPGEISMFNHYVHATRPRPATEGTPTMLRDGSTVRIRQVRGTDAPLLADGFARLSARSRQLRFLGPKKMLSAAELRYLTDVDHHDHEALGALSPADGWGIGVARYIRGADDPRAAG